jgi:Ca2+-binding RTX toxin-like protein
MSGAHRRSRDRGRRSTATGRPKIRAAADAALILLMVAVVAILPNRGGSAEAATAPPGQGFTVTAGDLKFILKQIDIAERHAATQTKDNMCGTLVGPGPNQIPDRLTSYGLRTVDGSCNNLIPGREKFAAADETFPRLTKPVFSDADNVPDGFGPPGPSSYKQKSGNVFDSQPRVISNLIVDQTSTNPAAIAAAGFPVRTQGNPGLFPCTTEPDATGAGGVPADCVPAHHTLFIPNVTTDVGLSPPYNSMFTFFGQFFDHGVDQTVKGGGTVFVPLKADDPLIAGPDHILADDPATPVDETKDNLPPQQRFMVLTRAQNQPGDDGRLGTADDVQDAANTDSPWVDQSQTYTSHSSHQVFLREYVSDPAGPDGILANDPATRVDEAADNDHPVANGKLLGGLPGNGATGMATWASVKAQAATMLGLKLVDADVTNIPMIAADPYGKFIPGPARGLPQYVTKSGLVEGNRAAPVAVPTDAEHFNTPFLTDIAHNADPSPADLDHNPATPPVAPVPDDDTTASADFAKQPAGTYDDEMLEAHFCAGDGRVNENIALTAVHQIFHSEHDRLVEDIRSTLTGDTSDTGVAALKAWKVQAGPDGIAADDPATSVDEAADNSAGYNFGERLFQAARFVTEMEYQHLVFEEFARKVQPGVRPFHLYHSDINAAIPAEFAHAVYRFGHSMLDDDVARTNENPATGAKTDHSLKLLDAFLNPPEYFNSGGPAPYTPEQAAGSIIMGSSDQAGNELDEFVTETLRNNLLGLPLDLPTINMTRAREAGVPPLNQLRRQIFAETNDGQMTPYTDWSDFGQHLKHPESLINFVAAYGKHSTITSATTLKAKRAAAKAIVDPQGAPATDPADIPKDAADFMFSQGAYKNTADGVTITGVDDVDLWVGGLSEITNVFGGLLGSTFNYVFQNTLENLQDGDRLYYLARTPGMNLRTQLEGNSFSELIERNTEGTHTLKADAFATADCKFELGHLAGTPAGFGTFGSTVGDDLTSECDESKVLLRKPDGTLQYRQFNAVDPSGINGQSVYNGTPGPDRVFGGNDNDTFWGDDGNDVIEGNGGDDVALGGKGNDILTDLSGADVQKGGPGNDAIDGGLGDDIPMGGDGKDFINGGANDNETFAGPDDDFVIGGQGADVVFGDGGDDWLQGGSGQDLLEGDHSAPFFDDPAEVAPGNDVFVGQVGENDYDAEGGDDLMAQNSAIDRNAGSGGFDWAFHQYDTVGADDDMAINNNLIGVPLPVVVNRDRWQETEADSGSAFNDVIRGDNDVPSAVGGAGFTGCDVLDAAGLARIKGLAALLPPLTGDLAPVVANSQAGGCPLSGPVWGEGNILLGGAGSDTIEGRGADDVIDGDKALSVRISVRTNVSDPATEIGSTDLMEHQYLRTAAGALTGPTLQAAVFKGDVDPGNLVIVREITPPAKAAAADCAAAAPVNCDTAVFSAPLADYTVDDNGSRVTVTQTVVPAGQKVSDGVDTLRNVERLKFSDQTLTIGPAATLATVPPAANVNFGSQRVGLASAARTVVLTNTGTSPLHVTDVRVTLPGANATDFTVPAGLCATAIPKGGTCNIPVTFRPSASGARNATLQVTDDSVLGSTQTIGLTGVGNSPPTGAAVLSTLTPAFGTTITVNTSTIADADLLGTLRRQWQQTNQAGDVTTFAAIGGATGTSFTVPGGGNGLAAIAQRLLTVGRRYRVVISYTDGAGNAEQVNSASTARIAVPASTPVPAAPAAVAAPAAATVAATAPAAAVPAAAALAPAPASSPAPPALAGAPAVPAAASGLQVSAPATGAAPITVAATVARARSTVQISVFRLLKATGRAGARRGSRRHVATVFRMAPTAKRYTFRLTEPSLRNLKPGRYVIVVRVGPSRSKLGRPVTRTIVRR